MVNRGGRSKACRTCKRRRVKCDQSKPHCQRCDKAGLNCEGYVTHSEFVDESSRYYQGKSPAESDQLQLELVHKPAKTPERQIWRPSPVLLDENVVIHAHLISRLDEVEPLMINLETHPSVETTRALAVRALAAVYFGKTNHDKRIFDAGSREYGRVLKRLQIDLASSTTVLEWDTLASVICLSMFENIVFTERTGFLKHYEGITQLILCALIHRRHCYLALPEWTTIPWPPNDLKTASDVLHDIFAHVPGHLHDMDRVERDEVDADFINDLRLRVESTLTALHNWELFYQHPRPLTGHLPHATSRSGMMHSVRDKTLLALQRAIILCMSGLCALLDLPLVSDIPVAHNTQQAVKTAIATEICHLATSCVGHESHTTGPLLFIFPLQIASMNFESGSVEERRAEEIMNEVIAGTHGFEIGRRREWRNSSVKS
ncbi:hypothetical protein FSARC_7337 [Fusarium sarcochroum]|uniref:Zn(2)-C6 fungal-type domain-containing protein n=1 Tax=Fusarium sarcochroum TaxID=1208366 RepID=A0A8H4TV47_9HYPO|nr:hypothetical protein FSARC_7337 [Fusarium sarcochroum]